MDKNFHKEFKKCPCCESGNRFLEQLGDELKERGLAREDWSFHLDVRNGVVLDQTKEASIPIGSEIPGYGIMTDICMNCGCVYAVDIARIDAKKSIVPTVQIPPLNRAARRRLGQDGGSQQGPFIRS